MQDCPAVLSSWTEPVLSRSQTAGPYTRSGLASGVVQVGLMSVSGHRPRGGGRGALQLRLGCRVPPGDTSPRPLAGASRSALALSPHAASSSSSESRHLRKHALGG